MKKRNREKMPLTAKMIDAYVAVFGRPKWFRFTENGKTVEWGEQ